MLQIHIKEKKFGDKLVLKDVVIAIPQNGIYGFVGKNGQGKTTLFKCISGYLSFDGQVLNNQNKLECDDIAFCPTEVPLYDELTAHEFYDFYKALLGLDSLSSECLFDVPGDKLVKEFSTGMKKKTFLNAIFQKKYSVYIFDEPFNGLDVESNFILMKFIKKIASESIVFISSHILDILFKDCESIFLIKNTNIKQFNKETFLEIERELFNNV